MKKEEILNQIHDDPLFCKVKEKLDEEELRRVESSLNAFLDDLVGPLLENLEKAMNDPETKEELKRQLGIQQNVVVKK